MKRGQKGLRAVVAGCAAAAGLSASCALSSPFSPLDVYALDLTEGIGRAHDEILLLNVVRAMHRHPQHWTTVTLARGVEAGSVGAGLDLPFGGAAVDDHLFKPSAQYSRNPSFDLTSQSSAEFLRGIMQPASLEQIGYFLEQGWPPSFVFALMVREIERWTIPLAEIRGEGDAGIDRTRLAAAVEELLAGGGRAPEELVNEPDPERGLRGYRAFRRGLDAILAERLTIVERAPQEIFRSRRAGQGAPGLDDVVGATEAGLVVVLEGDDLVVKRKRGLVLRTARRGGATVEDTDADADAGPARDEAMQAVQSTLEDQVLVQTVDGDVAVYRITFRSAEGLVYFLGQVMRAQGEQPGWRPTYEDTYGTSHALFSARRARRFEDGLVRATFQGERYVIPSDLPAEDRTMMTFTFASLLIGLNKQRADLPSSGTVLSLPALP